MKKMLTIVLATICVMGGGVWGTEHVIRQHMANQVVNILDNSSTESQINQLVGSVKNPAGSKGNGSTPVAPVTVSKTTGQGGRDNSSPVSASGIAAGLPSRPVFTSRAQVMQYAMSHFTSSEITHYTYLYFQRGSLSQSEKSNIKAQILSHFTPQELQTMLATVHKYQN